MTEPNSLSSPTGAIDRLSIAHQGRTYDLSFPQCAGTRIEIQNIFNGQEYPLLDLPGYSPTVIVDIGAHVGAAALYFHLLFPQAQVYCFEPSASNFALLKQNLSFNDKIRLLPYGLLDKEESRRLFTGPDHSMQNSFLAGRDATSAHEPAEVRRASDEFSRLGINAVSILKLDTEGCEVPILRDLATKLTAIDQLYVEYHSERDRLAIDEILKEQFMLALGRAVFPHRGTLLYVSKAMTQRFEQLNSWRIGPE